MPQNTNSKLNAEIRIGNQTSFSAEPIQPFEYAIENGFSAFEWFPDKQPAGQGWEIDDLSAGMRSDIKKRALEHDVRMSIHSPWTANPLTTEGQAAILECFKLARDIDAKLVNFHLLTDKSLEAYSEAIEPLIKFSAELGVKISLENTPITTPDDFNNLFRLLGNLTGVNSEQVGMCFDVGHANLCGLTKNDYIGFLDRLDLNIPINHIHLHENHGDYDAHLTVFTGPAKNSDTGLRMLIERLKKRGFTGSMILEQWPQPPLLLNQARDRLNEIISES